jgi:fatty-acid desaturase
VELGHSKSEETFSRPLALIVGSVHAVALWGLILQFSWSGVLALCAGHLFFSVFGISLGYHRYLSHRSFKTVPAFESFLGLTATLCLQGGPIYWAAVHRAHHIRSEKIGDAHSALRGFWWSHIGWMFFKRPNGFSYSANQHLVTELRKRPFLVFLDKNQLVVNLAFLGIIFLVCTALSRTDLFFWFGPIRIVSVWHSTWLINSYYHGASLTGGSVSGMKNNLVADVLLGGEGWHKAHHERPGVLHFSAPAHLDIGFYVLLALSFTGLVTLPRKIEAKEQAA